MRDAPSHPSGRPKTWLCVCVCVCRRDWFVKVSQTRWATTTIDEWLRWIGKESFQRISATAGILIVFPVKREQGSKRRDGWSSFLISILVTGTSRGLAAVVAATINRVTKSWCHQELVSQLKTYGQPLNSNSTQRLLRRLLNPSAPS